VTVSSLLLAVAVLAVWVAVRAATRRAVRRLPGVVVTTRPMVGSARRALARTTRARTWRRFDDALPETAAAIARALRSGASLHTALAEAATASPEPLAGALREVVAEAATGVRLVDAFDGWARRCPRPDVALLVTALAVAHDTGGASAQAVDGVAATLRRRQAARAEAFALATQARTSAYVLAGAPLVVCALAVAGGAGSARFLFGTPVGVACLALGLALDAVGAWWMVRLTRGRMPV